MDFGTGYNAWGVAVGDLNGDGRPDFVFANQYDNTISIYENLVPVTGLDHFAWQPVPTPRAVGAPVSVTLTAQNYTNGVASNYVGSAELETTNGIPVSPSVSGNFVQGVWTGHITISQVASNVVLEANDGVGHIGLANAINIVSPPGLTIQTSGATPVISWPVSPGGFILETSPSLTSPSWTQVSGAIQFGNQLVLPVPTMGANAYYRLRFVGP